MSKLLLSLMFVSGVVVADDVDYQVEDLLPGYVCMTKDQTKAMNESSRLLGYRKGYVDAKKEVIRKMKVKLYHACKDKANGGEGKLEIGEDLVFYCK